MKTLKKISLGLGLFIALFSAVAFSSHHRAYALSNSDFQQPPATYNLVGGTITAKLGSGVTVNFVNNNSSLSPLVFVPNPMSFTGGKLCSGSQITLNTLFSPQGQIKVQWVNNASAACINLSPSYSGTINIAIAGVPPPATPSTTTTSCDANYSHPFTWILCPAMSLADDAAGQFNSFIDQQLCFNTGSTSSTGGIVCKGDNNLTDQVKSAWNIFKNIASALLVIVMLVMVISQAVGGGPFDAYTVRKMLPKLVAAVIIMQLSWILIKWAVDLTNDVGSAINSLLLAPFGGTGHISLKNLVGFDLSSQSSATSTAAATFTFFAALAGAAIVSVPGLAMMALYVVLALLTAFVVLLLRKMLIIFMVIMAPVAFVLWILPGTERYWKLWSDNFIKLLVMFPLIEGLIAAGRIFAYVASGSPSGTMMIPHSAVAHLGPLTMPYLATFTNFVQLIIIVGAWFAPYFLLPQTYKWGGAAMGAAAKGVSNGVERLGKPANEYLKWRQGLSPWKQARAQRRAITEQRAKRHFAERLRGGSSLNRARLLGVDTPGGNRDVIERASRSAQAEVAKAEREEDEFANLRLQEEIDRTHPQDHDSMVRARALGQTSYRDRSGATVEIGETNLRDRIAASRKLLQLGGTGNLRVYEQTYQQALAAGGGSEHLTQFKRGITADIGTVSSQIPHIIKGVDATVDQLNEDSFASLSGAEMETLLGDLSQRAAGGDVAAQRRLGVLATKFRSALRTPGKVINTGAADAMVAFVSDSPASAAAITRINSGRGAPGNPQIQAGQRRRIDATDPALRGDIESELASRGILPTP